MAVLKFLSRARLRRSWKYDVAGVLWRLVPTASGQFVGEERDLLKKSASFFCLDQNTGKVNWEGATFGESWWIGIEAVHRDMFFLHGFAAPDLPEHKAIIAADLLKGTRVWSNENVKFIGARDESVYAALDTPGVRKIIEMQYRTGAILRSFSAEEAAVRNLDLQEPSLLPDSLRFPVAVSDLSSDSSLAMMAIQRHCRGKSIVGAVEMLDLDDQLVVFNYHERSGQQETGNTRLRNILQILDKNRGAVLFDDVLDSAAAAVVPDSFFVQHHTLYYVADRHRLTAVPLSQPSKTI